jgi:hypothetical protein
MLISRVRPRTTAVTIPTTTQTGNMGKLSRGKEQDRVKTLLQREEWNFINLIRESLAVIILFILFYYPNHRQ